MQTVAAVLVHHALHQEHTTEGILGVFNASKLQRSSRPEQGSVKARVWRSLRASRH